MRRWLKWAAAVLFVPPLVYMLLALLLAFVPVNREFRPARDGVVVYLRTNGVHADIVVPSVFETVDWRHEFPASHMRELDASTPWLAFGWGDRAFYLNTPTWSDLRFTTAMQALSGLGRGAMHIDYIDHPHLYQSVAIPISRAQYVKLVKYLRASFTRDANGKPLRIDAPGFSFSDAFYEAEPVYTFWFTCNEWVRRGLAVTGVRVPAWAPFDHAMFFQLQRVPVQGFGGT